MKRMIGVTLGSLLFVSSTLLAAEIERTDLGDRIPSKQELVEMLKLAPPLPSRSGGAPTPPPPRAISSAINFQLNSDLLEDSGKEFLNQLAAALSDDALSDSRLMLEGHADATGPEEHNLNLSARRADAVKRYLVDVWGVSDTNLSTVGKGESDLLDKANPESAANRVVVIINTGTRSQ